MAMDWIKCWGRDLRDPVGNYEDTVELVDETGHRAEFWLPDLELRGQSHTPAGVQPIHSETGPADMNPK